MSDTKHKQGFPPRYYVWTGTSKHRFDYQIVISVIEYSKSKIKIGLLMGFFYISDSKYPDIQIYHTIRMTNEYDKSY